jgi:hypothetical protein
MMEKYRNIAEVFRHGNPAISIQVREMPGFLWGK